MYRASLFPSLGYNTVFLGGDEQVFNPELAARTYGEDWLVRRTAEIRQPGRLLAFASARSRTGDQDPEPGYFAVNPPCLVGRRWAPAFDEAAPPDTWGYVHPRWNGRAMAAFTDGHAASMTTGELQDMRHWANPADRPDWSLRPLETR